MAWVRVDQRHQQVLDLLVSSHRVASVAGRTRTGPYTELRQVLVLAAAVGFASHKRQPIEKAGDTSVRDTVLIGAPGAAELAFALAYRDEHWDLAVVADGDAASDRRLKTFEEYAAGGFEVLTQKYQELGANVSAAELLHAVRQTVQPPARSFEDSTADTDEDPLIAMLMRTGKLHRAPDSKED